MSIALREYNVQDYNFVAVADSEKHTKLSKSLVPFPVFMVNTLPMVSPIHSPLCNMCNMPLQLQLIARLRIMRDTLIHLSKSRDILTC